MAKRRQLVFDSRQFFSKGSFVIQKEFFMIEKIVPVTSTHLRHFDTSMRDKVRSFSALKILHFDTSMQKKSIISTEIQHFDKKKQKSDGFFSELRIFVKITECRSDGFFSEWQIVKLKDCQSEVSKSRIIEVTCRSDVSKKKKTKTKFVNLRTLDIAVIISTETL